MSPKRRKKSAPAGPRLLLLIFAAAAILFLAGESVRWVRSDAGTFTLARTLGWGDRPRLTEIVGRQIRRGLASSSVPRDSVTESPAVARDQPVRWRIGIAPEASLIQTNFSISEALRETGGTVFSGHERPVKGGAEVVMLVGVGRQHTHELTIVRGGRAEEKSAEHPARVALVLYGFAEDGGDLAKRLFALDLPFAVAIPPDGKTSWALFRDAHHANREVVLHLPLEPINYPQVSPGPGTLLVSWKPAKITSEMRREISQANPIVAVANLMGSLATQDMTVMTTIYQELHRERLPFVHLNPAPGSVCRPLASKLGVAYAEPDAVIDGETRYAKPLALAKAWKSVLASARPGSERVVWLRATKTSVDWMAQSLDPAKLKGVNLVPLSALLRRPPER